MAADIEDFKEVLDTEMVVEMEKLRDMAFHGVPGPVRGEVWRFLLGVSKPDKSQEFTLRRRMADDYSSLQKTNLDAVKQARSDLQRSSSGRAAWTSPAVRDRLDAVLAAFYNSHPGIDYVPGTVFLFVPLLTTMPKDSDAYYSASILVRRLAVFEDDATVRKRVARFTMCFRALLPELYNHFEDEEINNRWVTSWLRFLLSRELPLPCLVRLWDSYFAISDGFELHLYVCLAILLHCSDELLEMDTAELLVFLQHLPEMDMNQVISKAYNLFEDLQTRGLVQ